MDFVTILLIIIAVGVVIAIFLLLKKKPEQGLGDNKLIEENARLNADLSQKNQTIGQLTKEFQNEKTEKDKSLGENKQLSIKIANLESKISQLESEKSQLIKKNTIFEQTEFDRKSKYENDVAALNSIRTKIENDREREVKEQQEREINRFTKMKETWRLHEKNVEEKIKNICQENSIEYIGKESAPFKGKPDNAIKICDEFVIFDAKSPASDDLDNFPSYIKLQTESVKKYIKEENVKKDIFLVIPSNTVHKISQLSFNMADYRVYVVTIDALEPIILSLKKIEEYEFVDQLSPEERDDICRIIGKFAHITKRRIQIDQFFGRQFLDIFSKFDDLPHDVQEKVIEYERSEKLNPPQEKRTKLISGKELEADSQKIKKEAEAKEIVFPESIKQMLDEN